MAKYILTKKEYLELKKHANSSLPKEACGLLGVKTGLNEEYNIKVYFTFNSSVNNYSFKIKRSDFLNAKRIAVKEGYKIVGCFHSHPKGLPLPSKSDINFGRKCKMNIWLIYSVKSNGINMFLMNKKSEYQKFPKTGISHFYWETFND